MIHFKKTLCLTLLAISFLRYPATAQNIILNTDGTRNVSLDYMAKDNMYLLLGNSRTTQTINGMSNSSPFGYLGRIMLQVVDDAPATQMLKTYCTQEEVDYIKKNGYNRLSVHFSPFDAKQTRDGGFIICGSVLKNSETTTFNELPWAPYNDIFLLKTDRYGKPQWYKRYDNGDWLYSVVEDAETGNFIACGKNSGAGFILCVDGSGTPQWARQTQTPFSDNPEQLNTSYYTEITPYNYNGEQYYALTGTSGWYYQIGGYINKGGVLLTLLKASGTVYNNVVITGDYNYKFLQGAGIHNAYDGDVVISGGMDGTVCGDKNGNNVLLAKIDPITLNMNFLKTYNSLDAGFASSVTVNVEAGKIHMAGTDWDAGSSHQMYMTTDYNGNSHHYVSHHNEYSPISGTAIVYNTANGYPVYSGLSNGISSGEGSTLIQDKWGYDCSPVQEPEQEDVPFDIFEAFTEDIDVNEIPEPILAFDLPLEEKYHCRSIFSPALMMSKTPIDNEALTLAPNPATNNLTVNLPERFEKNASVQIQDATGKNMPVHTVTGDAIRSVTLDVSNLAAGFYILSVNDGRQTKYAKFSKQ